MAHNLNMKDGRASIAFRGSRSDVWHQLGQEAQEGWTAGQWASNAGLAWTARNRKPTLRCYLPAATAWSAPSVARPRPHARTT